MYTIRAEAGESPKAFRLLGDAYERAFGVRITREKREVAVLVLTAGDNWAKDGFRGSAKEKWTWTGSVGNLPDRAKFHDYDFEGADMDNIADRTC